MSASNQTDNIVGEVVVSTHSITNDISMDQEQTSTIPKTDDDDDVTPTGCCSYFAFEGVSVAQGYSYVSLGRGALVMSNIFLTSSFLYLASDAAGCLDENDEMIDDCDGKVYGFSPAALITNIVVISGLLSAFFMPIIGAFVDFTPHRKLIGILTAFTMGLIQVAQIGTLESTWFVMMMFQAVAGFLYQVGIVAIYAYLPDIGTRVGQSKMADFSSKFTAIQFGAQSAFLILIIGLSYGVTSDSVQVAQLSQSINAVWIAIAFYFGWKLMPFAPANNALEEGQSVLTEGFKQNWRTAKSIHRDYKDGMRWFFCAVAFAEASAAAITSIAVIYLDETLGMDGTQIGQFFLVTLLASLPGTKLGAYVTHRTNPNTSWRICMVSLFGVLVAGALILDNLNEDQTYVAYLWGACVGTFVGWFYPTENLFFSMCLPEGQEAELAGFFVYCTQILAWLPPLMFSVIVESGASQKWGVIVTSLGFVAAVVCLSCAAPWEEIVAAAGRGNETIEIPKDTSKDMNEEDQDEPSEVASDTAEPAPRLSLVI